MARTLFAALFAISLLITSAGKAETPNFRSPAQPPARQAASEPPAPPAANELDKEGAVANPDETSQTLNAGNNTVPGLTLPPSFDVSTDEMFVDLTAQCTGQVAWLVVSATSKVKYKLYKEGDLNITVGIPPQEGVITVFCIGNVKGRFTNWASTNINVKKGGGVNPTPGPTPPGPTPPPTPNPLPPPLPPGTKLHYTVIEETRDRTVEVRKVVESIKVRQAVGTVNGFTDKDKDDPAVASFVAFLAKKNVPLPAIVVQVNDGTKTPKPAVYYGPLPKTEADMLALVAQLQGGK